MFLDADKLPSKAGYKCFVSYPLCFSVQGLKYILLKYRASDFCFIVLFLLEKL